MRNRLRRAQPYLLGLLAAAVAATVVTVIATSDSYSGADVTFRDGATAHCEDFWISGWGEKTLSCTYDNGSREIFPMDLIESVIVLEDV